MLGKGHIESHPRRGSIKVWLERKMDIMNGVQVACCSKCIIETVRRLLNNVEVLEFTPTSGGLGLVRLHPWEGLVGLRD
jgi:hypothetical protein